MWENAVFDMAASADDRAHNGIAVQSQLHGLPHTNIVQRFDIFIERDIGDPNTGSAVDQPAVNISIDKVFTVPADIFQVQNIHLSVFKKQPRRNGT